MRYAGAVRPPRALLSSWRALRVRPLSLAFLLAAACAGCSREPAKGPGAASPAGEPSAAANPAPVSPAAVAPAAAPRPAAAGRHPSILLVTIDTWRWDALGVSGSGRVATPRLDALASGGVYLRKVQTTCPLTTPAHATILTGLLPRRHGVRDNAHYRLNPGVETLASVLARAGYFTAAVVSGAPLRKLYGLDRGFASYDDSGLLGEGEEAFVPSQRPADRATDRAVSALASLPAGRPAFLWVHYYDPHIPYAPPEPYRSRYAAAPTMVRSRSWTPRWGACSTPCPAAAGASGRSW